MLKVAKATASSFATLSVSSTYAAPTTAPLAKFFNVQNLIGADVRIRLGSSGEYYVIPTGTELSEIPGDPSLYQFYTASSGTIRLHIFY